MKQFFKPEDIERKVILILKILNESSEAVGARVIARKMSEQNVQLSERTVRYHLKLMDERGLTKLVGRRDGRAITRLGMDEISNARVQDKIGLSISRIDVLSFRTTFSLKKMHGLTPVNVSFFPQDQFKKALAAMKPVFKKNLAVSSRVAIAPAGKYLGDIVVPEGKVGLATICSILINGVLLKHGIPIDSKFSLENYNRIIQEEDLAKKEELEKIFCQDLKNRIDETAKYIRPNEGALDFAFMFIPAEAIYYDLLVNKIGAMKSNTRDMIDYAVREKKVHIVSPTSFYVYLQTILQGLRSMQIEESGKEIRKRVEQLSRHLMAYDEYMKKLGGHLGTTVNAYNSASKEFNKIDKDVIKITEEDRSPAEIQQADKPLIG